MIGIDAVEIERFNEFAQHEKKQLLKIFTQAEIDYCLMQPALRAQRFASHFAAKEACYKALSPHAHTQRTFLSAVKHIELTRNSITQAPILMVDWHSFGIDGKTAHISITHTHTTAIAVVMLHERSSSTE